MNPVRTMVSGGLGNQMFQYAACYALAKRLGTELILDNWSYGFDPLRKYSLGPYGILPAAEPLKQDTQAYITLGLKPKLQKLLPAPVFDLAKFIYKKTVFRLLQKQKENTSYTEKDFHLNREFFELKNGVAVTGVFQSEKYFNDVADDLRQIFALKTSLTPAAETVLQAIKQTPISVSLHVRRGDYLSNANINLHGTASLDYYKKAVHLIKALYGEVKFFVFTDDVAYVKDVFDFLGNYLLVSDTVSDQHEDMFLMSQCRHHIIANSSFSWWGAWLNPSKDKTVIAPRQWFSDEYLRERNVADLYPKGWILL